MRIIVSVQLGHKINESIAVRPFPNGPTDYEKEVKMIK